MYDSQRTNGDSRSFWYEPSTPASEPTTHEREPRRDAYVGRSSEWPQQPVDVVVVGAGITGLSTAYHLLELGRSVLVIDKGAVGCGETGRSTAHLANALDDRYWRLERMHGRRGARLAAESHAAAIASIEAIAAREQIACDLRRVDGYLFAAAPHQVPRARQHVARHPRRELRRELAAARRAGLEVELIEGAPLPFATGPALRFGQQAQFDPLAYVQGLAAAIERRGGHVCTGVRMRRVEPGAPVRVEVQARASGQRDEVERRVLVAGCAVIATNSPIVDVLALHTKQAPYRSYAIALTIPQGSVTPALYWDTEDPYHYVRVGGRDDVLIVGGEDHKVGQSKAPEQSWARLEQWTRDRFPCARETRQRWSGQIWEPADSLAFIGRDPAGAQNVFIASGDSGNGITHGALAGLLLADLIAGRSNPWADLYDPARKLTRPQAAREYVRENLNVALRYGEWLWPGGATGRIEPGQGAVVRRGLKRVAVYVDESGQRHECSAVCTHLGGLVSWNRAERSWDCPCHGSRFDPFGRVLTGPAKRDLAPLSSEREPARAELSPPPGE